MELGATLCLPRSPQCLLCPIAKFCDAKKLGVAEVIPEKLKKRATVIVQLVSVVLLDTKSNSLLLCAPAKSAKRSADDHIPSLVAKLWHFPTISAPASDQNALGTLLRAGLRIKPAKSRKPLLLDKVRHTVTYRAISVAAYLLNVKRLPDIVGAKIVPLETVSSLAISNLTRKIARTAVKQLSRPNPYDRHQST